MPMTSVSEAWQVAGDESHNWSEERDEQIFVVVCLHSVRAPKLDQPSGTTDMS